ncbi:hypothetical protein GCM10027262_41330 [Nocardia tengchongensis]
MGACGPSAPPATARVIHGLSAVIEDDVLVSRYWPSIARLVLDRGITYPAAVELARMEGEADAAIDSKVAELSQQLGRLLGDSPRLDPWDAVAGVYGRAWRMGLIDPTSAVWRMNSLWSQIRDLDESESDGLQIIWDGMQIKEQDDGSLSSEWIDRCGDELLARADELIPPGAIDRPLCESIREAMLANGY